MWWNEAFEIKVSQHSNVRWRISTGVKGRSGMKESLHEAPQPWAWAKQMNMYLSRVKSQMYRICTRSRNEHQGHTHSERTLWKPEWNLEDLGCHLNLGFEAFAPADSVVSCTLQLGKYNQRRIMGSLVIVLGCFFVCLSVLEFSV